MVTPSISRSPSSSRRGKLRMMCVNGLDRFAAQEIDGGGEAGEAEQVVVAGLVLVGQLVGLAVFVALRAGAAAAERLQLALDARPDVEHAGAQRPEQAFVSGRGQQVDVEVCDVDRHVAERLGRVDQKQRVASRGRCGRFRRPAESRR